jgi:carboxymethylenebutenolidase
MVSDLSPIFEPVYTNRAISCWMHLGEEDEFHLKAAQAQNKAVLAKKPNATVYSYPRQRHAFSRHNGAHYNAAAAALANGRTSEFLKQQLR